MKNTHGKDLLKSWMQNTGRSKTWTAKQVPVSIAYFYRWLAGTATPRPVYRLRINEITDGEVPVDSWEVDG